MLPWKQFYFRESFNGKQFSSTKASVQASVKASVKAFVEAHLLQFESLGRKLPRELLRMLPWQ